jgi:hypothetical protein
MELALQIGAGIWIGGMLLALSIAAYCAWLKVANEIRLNRRHGSPWHAGLARAWR